MRFYWNVIHKLSKKFETMNWRFLPWNLQWPQFCDLLMHTQMSFTSLMYLYYTYLELEIRAQIFKQNFQYKKIVILRCQLQFDKMMYE